MRPSVSVVVPVLDGAATIGGLLDALEAQDGVAGFEVLVVDNGSEDTTVAIAEAHPVVTAVVAERHPGSYAARNRGIATAGGDVLAFVDADCRPDPGWLAAGTAALDRADLVAGRIDGEISDRPTLWERYDQATYLDQERLVEDRRMAATANLFVARRVIDRIGPFDRDLRSSGDAEFVHRATRAGFALVYAPDARVAHRCRATLRETWRLHRRLGDGWAVLAARGRWPRALTDVSMRVGFGDVADAVVARGPVDSPGRLAGVHAIAMLARWVGRAEGAVRASRSPTEVR